MDCIAKKNGWEINRTLVTSHCVGALNDPKVIDMCLLGGEGKPSLIQAVIMSHKQAHELGNALIHVSNFVSESTKEQKEKMVKDHVIFLYQILKEVDKKRAEELKNLFESKVLKGKKETLDQGYIG